MNGELIYVVTKDGTLHCLGLGTGAELWNASMKAAPASMPVVRGDTLFTWINDGFLHAIKILLRESPSDLTLRNP